MQKYTSVGSSDPAPAAQLTSSRQLSVHTERSPATSARDRKLPVIIAHSDPIQTDRNVVYQQRSTYTKEHHHIIPPLLPPSISIDPSTDHLNVNTLRAPLCHGFLSVTLLIVNVSQLRYLIRHPHPTNHPFYPQVFWSLLAAIVLQIAAMVILLLSYWSRSKTNTTAGHHFSLRVRRQRCVIFARCLENIYLLVVFSVLTINVFVALFINSADGDHAGNQQSWPVVGGGSTTTTPLRNLLVYTSSGERGDDSLSSSSSTTVLSWVEAVSQSTD